MSEPGNFRLIEPPGNPANRAVLPVRPAQISAPPSRDVEQSQLVEYWSIVKRQWWAVLGLAILGCCVGFVFAMMQPPLYRASTTLDIQGLNDNFLNIRELVPTGAGGFSPEYLQTEIKILQSASMLHRVVDKLKTAPEHKAKPAMGAGRLMALLIRRQSLPSREQMVAETAASVQVRALGVTRIVEVICDSKDPDLAKDFCNTLAEEYTNQNLQSRWEMTQHTGEWLRRQLADLKLRLEQSEQQLQTSAKDNALLISDTESLGQEKLRQVQAELQRVQALRIGKQSEYEVAEKSPPNALPEVLDNAALREYRARITDLRRQVAEAEATMTPAHYKVRELQGQLRELEAAESRHRQDVIGRIKSEFDSAQKREALLLTEYNSQVALVSQQAGRGVRYNMLKREVESGRKIYETMLQRVEEVGLASAMRASAIRVVDPATEPRLPYTPNPVRSSMIGGIVCTFAGICVALFRARIDRGLHGPGEAPVHLKVRELGVIPSVRIHPVRGLFDRGGATARRRDRTSILDLAQSADGIGDKLELTMWRRSASLLGESFFSTMNSLLFAAQNGWPTDVIILTSAHSGDGKTTISCNLAIALAQVKERVLLVDWDLRHPRLHDVFGVEKGMGLTDVLANDSKIEDLPQESFIRNTPVPGLFLLTAGDESIFSPRLLHSERAARLVTRLRRDFSMVVIDSPPILQVADARVIGKLSDGVLLILRAGKTTRDVAMTAERCFLNDGTPLLGTILNDWNPRKSSKYGSYQQYYSGRPAGL